MATLHNAQEVARKDIRAGDDVLIEKGGDVIPKVVESLPQRRPTGADEPQPWVMPTACPVCGSALRPRRRGSRSGAARTPSARRACAAASSTSPRARAMNIEGFGESLVDSVVDATGWSTIRRRLRPDRRRAGRASSGWARSRRPTSSARSTRAARRGLARVVYALGIRHVGERGAAALAGAFGSMAAHLRGVGRAAPGRARRRAGRRRVGAHLARRAGQPAPDRAPRRRRGGSHGAAGGRRARPGRCPARPGSSPAPSTA